MKKLCILVAALLLSGCAVIRAAVQANPEGVGLAAVHVESQEGIRCAGLVDDAQRANTAQFIELLYRRIGVDMATHGLLSEVVQDGIKQSRTLTDEICRRVAPVPPPLPPIVPPVTPAN